MKPRYHSKHTITSHYKVETLQSTLNGFLVVVGVQKQELHVGLGEPLLAAPGPHGHASRVTSRDGHSHVTRDYSGHAVSHSATTFSISSDLKTFYTSSKRYPSLEVATALCGILPLYCIQMNIYIDAILYMSHMTTDY